MTDRELLELAAKAAGYVIPLSYGFPDCIIISTPDRGVQKWNPLTDDGDALRLAVRLRFRVEVNERSTVVYWTHDESEKSVYEYPDSEQGDDYNIIHVGQDKATRRAIVRAAAEIGKGLK